LQIINTMGFSIKNYIEIQKLRMGVWFEWMMK
jgi:hypothetical protein